MKEPPFISGFLLQKERVLNYNLIKNATRGLATCVKFLRSAHMSA